MGHAWDMGIGSMRVTDLERSSVERNDVRVTIFAAVVFLAIAPDRTAAKDDP
jgi:hypothetical protein